MQTVKINGVHIRFERSGTAGALPLVFSNSLGTDFRVWDALIDQLGDGFDILRYDKRGHGLSDCPPAPYHMDDHIGDLAGLMDAVGFTNTIVVGLSVGGLIAQGLYRTNPSYVRALILCDTAHKIGTQDIWNDRIKAVEQGGIVSMADAILERWFSQYFRAEKTDELAAWRNMLVRTPADGYAGTSAAIRDTDMTDVAKSISVPTLCIVGSEDGATTPELVRSTADLIPGAQFKIIDGAGHLPCVEKPEEMATLITNFIKEKGLG